MKDGRLGLIDYGQVKKLTVAERTVYAKLILAHARNDRDEVVRIHFEEQGTKTKYMKPDIAYRMSSFYNDRDGEDVCSGMNMKSFIDWMEEQDPMIQLSGKTILIRPWFKLLFHIINVLS